MSTNNDTLICALKSLPLVLAAAAASSASFALDLSATAGLQAEHSDNMTKAPDNKRSDLKSTVSASVNAEHEGEKVKVDLSYSAARSSYQQDSFDDETRVNGSGSVVYEQIDQQLIWTLENSRKNVIKNKALNDVEDNREDRSISSARVDFIMRPSSVDSLTFSPSYTDIKYEDTDNQDSGRIGGRINWTRALSKIDRVGLQVSYDDVTFDSDLFDYEYYLYTVNYQASLSKLSYSITAGMNESKRTNDDYDGQYFKANANYKVSRSLFSLDVLQELTDTSRGTNNEGLSENSSDFEEVDVFERSSIEISYQSEGLCNSCTLDLSLMYEDENYETLPRDNDELRLNTRLSYQWSRLISWDLGLIWQDVSFSNQALVQSDYESLVYRAALRWQLVEKLSAGFYIAYEDKEFDTEDRDYDELKGGVNLTYSFD